jgi:hypothetical protein
MSGKGFGGSIELLSAAVTTDRSIAVGRMRSKHHLLTEHAT